ncbi:MAG: hypothetical protein HYR96_06170 [Deltaproteobacteria bacterium]|nr:hypothetical protein [Deltaproteobacteria bacterium]MBI3295282.1 hypothetical protein [Deltaproteobacteria bacterium]
MLLPLNYRLAWILGLITPTTWGGVYDIIHFQPSGSHGQMSVMAVAAGVVSLRIEDSPGSGANLVGSDGINFGEVNNLGTTSTPGVNGWAIGTVGHYEADFLLTAERSGHGTVTLHVERSHPGNFNAKNGVEIADYTGALKPLSAHFDHSITVLSQVQPGTYEKRLAINIYPQDRGVLRTILKFTLCAL